MTPLLIPAEQKGNFIKPLKSIPPGGSLYILWISFQDFFKKPPTAASPKEISRDFEKTGKYSKAFLTSIEKGLGKSSLFKKHS